jgi:hypothetical protein
MVMRGVVMMYGVMMMCRRIMVVVSSSVVSAQLAAFHILILAVLVHVNFVDAGIFLVLPVAVNGRGGHDDGAKHQVEQSEKLHGVFCSSSCRFGMFHARCMQSSIVSDLVISDVKEIDLWRGTVAPS